MKKKSIERSNTFAKKNRKVLQNIQLLALDVDGILTDNRIWMTDSGEWRRYFSIKDGYGLVRLREAGIDLAILTGSQARDIDERVRLLRIQHYYPGSTDKWASLQKLLQTTGLTPESIAYMGDDLFDLPVLKKVGFSATAPEALHQVCKEVDYVTRAPGGNGAVREVCELILEARQKSRKSRN
jgi:3-deoxy-D-manno-octulosonate 8-phosphate phosphatase (KDO 8-P phosphatase)